MIFEISANDFFSLFFIVSFKPAIINSGQDLEILFDLHAKNQEDSSIILEILLTKEYCNLTD